MPSNKTSVKIDKDLSKQISIFGLLENEKKEDFINTVIKEGLKPYQDKYNKYKFK